MKIILFGTAALCCATSFGLPTVRVAPDSEDATPAFRAAVEQLRAAGGGTVAFGPGEYHFRAKSAMPMKLYVSNHDQTGSVPVQLPLVGLRNVTLKGDRTRFVLHGAAMGLAIVDSENVTVSGIAVDRNRPFVTEARVAGFERGGTLVTVDAKTHPYAVRSGKFFALGDGWEAESLWLMAFRGDTKALVERTEDIRWDGAVTETFGDGRFLMKSDLSKLGVKAGDLLALRPQGRPPHPAVFVYRARNTALEDVVLHTAWGMGVICQRSEDFAWRGTKTAAERVSGVFAPAGSGRFLTLNADATHFSNVKGRVTVENCLFEGMMDDAINVHATCLGIVAKTAPNAVRCRYMHEAAYGFETFAPGETLRFIRGRTLENAAEVRVTGVAVHDLREVTLTLAAPVPEGFGPGDAVENADYHPAVDFLHNVVARNRARGALFTTPRPVRVVGNLFERVSGSAILFAGDAQGWYESGACQDVMVRDNVFRDCMTSHFQFCDGILSFYPMVRDLAAQRRRYHRNALIEGNVFETADVPLLFAISTEDVTFRNNTVKYRGRRAQGARPPFVLSACARIRTDEGNVFAASPDADPAAEPLFYNVAPFSPGREKTVAADMREYVARTGNRKVLYSLTLHPEGRPAMKKVERALASYRALKAELAESDVELGVLLQAILGHWPRTDKEVEPWQRTVDVKGREVRFCWLDPRYQDYIRTVARLLAAEKPCFILGDDDIRAFSPFAECCCPLHVAEFNRRRGTSYTSAQLREAVAASKPGSPDFDAFMALQREQVNGVCRLIREGIDAADPTVPAGTCMPGWEYRFNDQASRAIAAKGQSTVMRMANGNYQERGRGTTDFIRIAQTTQSYFAFHRDRVDAILSEADTYPHHLWSRSATSWHAHLAMTLFTGLKGAKLWFVNAHKGETVVNRAYTDVLAENRGFYRELLRSCAGAEPVGLIEPCLTRYPTWHPCSPFGEHFVSDSTWARTMLGRMGVPYACERNYAKPGVWTLAGRPTVSRLSDDDLRAILSHRALVDGEAAVALTERGFSDLTGVTAHQDPTLLFTHEASAADGLKYRLVPSDRVPRLVAAAGAKELAALRYAPYSGATESERVAPGTTLFENRLGGKVVVTAFHQGVSGDQTCNEARQEWLFRIIDALAGEREVPCVANRQDVSVLATRTVAGDTLLAIFNLNFDPLKTIDLRVKGHPTVKVLKADGSWKSLEATQEGDLFKVAQSLPCYGVAVLNLGNR